MYIDHDANTKTASKRWHKHWKASIWESQDLFSAFVLVFTCSLVVYIMINLHQLVCTCIQFIPHTLNFANNAKPSHSWNTLPGSLHGWCQHASEFLESLDCREGPPQTMRSSAMRRKAGGKAETLAGDQRVYHLLADHTANAAQKPHEPHTAGYTV